MNTTRHHHSLHRTSIAVWCCLAFLLCASLMSNPVFSQALPDDQAKEFVGTWSHSTTSNLPERVYLNYRFTFRPDGTYKFRAGVGEVDFTQHSGQFTISPTPANLVKPKGQPSTYPYCITLTPDTRTINHNSALNVKLVLLHVASLSLPTDKPMTYRYRIYGPDKYGSHSKTVSLQNSQYATESDWYTGQFIIKQ